MNLLNNSILIYCISFVVLIILLYFVLSLTDLLKKKRGKLDLNFKFEKVVIYLVSLIIFVIFILATILLLRNPPLSWNECIKIPNHRESKTMIGQDVCIFPDGREVISNPSPL